MRKDDETTTGTPDFDPRDGARIRAIDGEPTDAAADDARLAQLRRRSERLSGILADLDPTPDETARSAAAIRRHMAGLEIGAAPRRSGLPMGWRVAAGIALLLAVGLAVEPARAWMLERLRDVAAAIGVGEPASPRTAPDPAAADGAPIEVVAPLAGDTLYLDLAVPPAEIVARRSPTPDARLRVRQAPDATLTVLSRSVRVDTRASGRGVLEIELPLGVAAITLTNADGRRSTYVVEDSDAEIRIGIGGMLSP